MKKKKYPTQKRLAECLKCYRSLPSNYEALNSNTSIVKKKIKQGKKKCHYVAQTGLELSVLLPQPPECWELQACATMPSSF
jgi:hypothetical protein